MFYCIFLFKPNYGASSPSPNILTELFQALQDKENESVSLERRYITTTYASQTSSALIPLTRAIT